MIKAEQTWWTDNGTRIRKWQQFGPVRRTHYIDRLPAATSLTGLHAQTTQQCARQLKIYREVTASTSTVRIIKADCVAQCDFLPPASGVFKRFLCPRDAVDHQGILAFTSTLIPTALCYFHSPPWIPASDGSLFSLCAWKPTVARTAPPLAAGSLSHTHWWANKSTGSSQRSAPNGCYC